MTDLKIPDTSEFQAGASTPDWAGIKKQNGGAGICRVGYGTSHLDKMFARNYTAMKANKFSFLGLYHYIVAGQDITAQARAFCNWVGPVSAIYPGTAFMCDLEEGAGNQLNRANAWLGFVDRFYGLDSQPLPVRSWLYAGASFAVSAGMLPVCNSQRRTWIAAYSAAEPRIGHTLWQSTDGKVGSNITAWAGCGRIDTNVFHGSLAQLAAMGWKGTPARPVLPARPVTPPAGDKRYHGEWVSGGQLSLHDLAGQLGYPVNTVIRMTATHYGYFDGGMASYLAGLADGSVPPTARLAKGTRLWCD